MITSLVYIHFKRPSYYFTEMDTFYVKVAASYTARRIVGKKTPVTAVG